MLESLRIKNIALIDECTLTLGANLNILSGETGAGKSIIIDAFSFVLGARADKTLIRYGENNASVEAVFNISDSPIVKSKLLEMGFDDEDTLIIYRTMTDTKSDIRINGRVVTLSMLKEITSNLVDILGQHEHQSLLDVKTHLSLLDKYAEDEVSELKNKVAAEYRDMRECERALSEFGNPAERTRKLDILKYQIDEISNAELQIGEEEELLVKRERFRNSEKIVSAVSNANNALDCEESISVTNAISQAMSLLRSVTSCDPAIEDLYERLDSANSELKDIIDTANDYLESFDFDNATADFVERRVDLIRTLKRKYGGSVEEVLANLEKYREEYSMLADADEEIDALTAKREKIFNSLFKHAKELSTIRQKAGQALKNEIEGELSSLGMGGTVFEVNFAGGDEQDLTADGFDIVEFLISPNPGEPLRSLSRIISGGEMSRFMLALKVITARLDCINTLVFDEVDTGISGYIGEVVAEKLCAVSRDRQVIAITHLPQVAAYSDNHYLISKSTENGKTHTSILHLDENGVIAEIARLAAGDKGEYGTLHAKELRANALKNK